MNDRSRRSPDDASGASLERAIQVFEQVWRAASPPSIADALRPCDPDWKTDLAQELAAIDMEFRWHSTALGASPGDAIGAQPTWRKYVLFVPEIGAVSEMEPALIAEEYRVRQLWGDQPNHDHFISQYPERMAELPKWLSRIDAELCCDGVVVAATPAPFTPAIPDPRAPLPWSDYLLQEHLGSGGFGKVYRALQRSLDRPVAVKALHKARQQDPQAIEQFIHEARMLARLKHPGIVGVQGLGRYPGGGYFLVLDFIDGKDLQHRLHQGPLAVAETVRITAEVAEAIQHAHEHGVLHGDLKPSNVLIAAGGNVVVTDFGLGHLLSSDASGQLTSLFHGGTLAYLAPEVVMDGRIGVATDVFGLGALLYSLLTARPPRQNRWGESILSDLESGRPIASPAMIRRDVPPELDRLTMKCLEMNPLDRYAAAADVAAHLRRIRLDDTG